MERGIGNLPQIQVELLDKFMGNYFYALLIDAQRTDSPDKLAIDAKTIYFKGFRVNLM